MWLASSFKLYLEKHVRVHKINLSLFINNILSNFY